MHLRILTSEYLRKIRVFHELSSLIIILFKYIIISSVDLWFNWIQIWSRRSLLSSIKASLRSMPSDNGVLLMSVWKGAFLADVRKPLANGDDMKFKGSVEVRFERKGVLHFVAGSRYAPKPPSLTENSAARIGVYSYALCLRILSCTECIGCRFHTRFYEMFFWSISSRIQNVFYIYI